MGTSNLLFLLKQFKHLISTDTTMNDTNSNANVSQHQIHAKLRVRKRLFFLLGQFTYMHAFSGPLTPQKT